MRTAPYKARQDRAEGRKYIAGLGAVVRQLWVYISRIPRCGPLYHVCNGRLHEHRRSSRFRDQFSCIPHGCIPVHAWHSVGYIRENRRHSCTDTPAHLSEHKGVGHNLRTGASTSLRTIQCYACVTSSRRSAHTCRRCNLANGCGRSGGSGAGRSRSARMAAALLRCSL